MVHGLDLVFSLRTFGSWIRFRVWLEGIRGRKRRREYS
jgi:hypothetical protein